MKNYILEYSNLIKSKKIIVSAKIKKQIDKLVFDIINPKEYYFDLKKASKPIEFIETFCKHSKGQWAGKNVVLDLWQKMIIQAIFGFVDKDGFRRYREVLLVVARKNGKSTLLSAIALYLLFADKEGGAQICCVASKKDQARIVFNEAKNMVVQSPTLAGHIKKRKSDLYFPLTFSTLEPLASDSNTLDGLNVHGGIIDELHSIKDRNLYDVIKQSTTTRQQPLILMITTAGFVRECIYDDMYEYGDNVLNDVIKDDRFLPLIYELDSRSEWTIPKMWQKANPGLSTIKDLESLEENVARGKNDRKFLPTLLTKDFNIRETGVNSWLSFEAINNQETYDINNFKDIYAVGGVDLSSTTDLTCATIIFKKEEQFYVAQMYFIPEDKVEQKEKEDKVPYKIWEKQGYVRFCPGNKVNYSDVTEWFIELRDTYKIYTLWIGYDPWGASMWVDEMKRNGFQMLEVRQGARTMSSPMKLLSSELEAKKLNYNNNPILKWCLTNTQIEVDKNENIRPVKGRNTKQRIDGAVALIDAYVILQEKWEDYITMTNY